MPDYRRPLEFGISLSPDADDTAAIFDAAKLADRLGLQFIGIQDHPYQRRFLDTMSLLAALAATTEHLRVFPDVACLPLRHPVMLAKQAASIDIMSGGRFELGLGAGAFWEAIAAMGGPTRSPGEALRSLEEAIAVARLVWSDQRGIRFDGAHYQVSGLHGGPVPAHPIEIWLGVGGPRALNLLGRVADGWIPSIGRLAPADLDALHALIDEGAREAGREPAAIRRLANVPGEINDGPGGGYLEGPQDQWIDQATALATEHGVDTFIFWPKGDPLDQVGRYAELVPAIRDAVAAVRG